MYLIERTARVLKFVLSALLFVAATTGASIASGDDASSNDTLLWQALRSGGHAVLIRHAMAPGNGDPSAFTLGDCSTQRNLSDEGRAQARRIGKRLRDNGVQSALVFSSQWCRCLDTARLLALGPVSELAALNSFYEYPQRENLQNGMLKAWLSDRDLTTVHVLVTHQVNISALSKVYAAPGELVVVRPSDSGSIEVVGSIAID